MHFFCFWRCNFYILCSCCDLGFWFWLILWHLQFLMIWVHCKFFYSWFWRHLITFFAHELLCFVFILCSEGLWVLGLFFFFLLLWFVCLCKIDTITFDCIIFWLASHVKLLHVFFDFYVFVKFFVLQKTLRWCGDACFSFGWLIYFMQEIESTLNFGVCRCNWVKWDGKWHHLNVNFCLLNL